MANGSGGMDFNGLPLVVEMLGVDDVEGLLERLYLIKTHKPPERAASPVQENAWHSQP